MSTFIHFDESKEMDCIGLGRLCIDLNANEIHRPLEDVLSFAKYVGGSPANITIAMAKLGLKTGFIGRVADDAFGRYIVRYLEAGGTDTSNVVTDRSGSVTGLAFTEMRSPDDCKILMYRDNVADLKLEPGDIDESYIAGSKAIMISGTALAQSPSREAVFRAVETARKHGTKILFDIDYRPYSWQSKAETYTYCRLVAEKADVIFGGREEFDLIEQGSDSNDDATAQQWLRERAELVVVKHGGRGSVAYARTGERYQAGIFPTEVVNTFGAGDSFAGAFVYGLLQGWGIERCLEHGSAAASIVVGSHSCSEAMPTLDQIEALIAKHKGEG